MPKPFRFKLQKVLELREQREAQAQQALAQAQQRYQEAADALAALQRRLEEAERDRAARPEQSANELWLWRAYRQGMERDMAEAAARLQELAKELQSARQAVMERARERKLLEKLKENQEKRHVRDDELAEQKEFDEAAALRHGNIHF